MIVVRHRLGLPSSRTLYLILRKEVKGRVAPLAERSRLTALETGQLSPVTGRFIHGCVSCQHPTSRSSSGTFSIIRPLASQSRPHVWPPSCECSPLATVCMLTERPASCSARFISIWARAEPDDMIRR